MAEQDVNADNSDLNTLIADAENLLKGEETKETSEVKEETKEEVTEEVKEEKVEEEVKEEIHEEVAKEEVKEEIKIKDEELDHSEKSKFGRNVKFLTDKVTRLEETNRRTLELLEKLKPKEQEEETLPELPTGEDVVKIVEKTISKREAGRIANEQKAQESYQSTYLNLLDEAVGEDEELRNLLVDPKSPFNKTSDKGFFGNPAQDLLLNITKATKALRAQKETPKPNVKGAKPSVPTGVNVPSTQAKVTVPKVDTSKWGKEEQALANSGLFSDEELAELARI